MGAWRAVNGLWPVNEAGASVDGLTACERPAGAGLWGPAAVNEAALLVTPAAVGGLKACG